jgi:hypothetical protein
MDVSVFYRRSSRNRLTPDARSEVLESSKVLALTLHRQVALTWQTQLTIPVPLTLLTVSAMLTQVKWPSPN